VIVGFLQEAVDGDLEIDDRAKDAAFEAAFGQFGEEALDRIEPRGRGRGVMEDKARMPVVPGANLGVLVCRVVIENDVDDLVGRDVGFDRIEEANELLMAMTLHATADDLAFQDVERGEQSGCAVALVVMGHCRAAALLHRQTGLGAVERLDLRFLVDRQDHRMRRPIDPTGPACGRPEGRRQGRRYRAAWWRTGDRATA
jgi:hypothetical protein